MSPIRPENRDRYPTEWRGISDAVRFARAGGQCECEGECGMPGHADRAALRRMTGQSPRCANVHLGASVYTGSLVILTTAHLDHQPENCAPENLRAMCQGCHLYYDREHHAQTRRESSLARVGQVTLEGLSS